MAFEKLWSVPTPFRARTVDEILRDPPREVLDGFGQKRGPTWERFCRLLAGAVEMVRIVKRNRGHAVAAYSEMIDEKLVEAVVKRAQQQ